MPARVVDQIWDMIQLDDDRFLALGKLNGDENNVLFMFNENFQLDTFYGVSGIRTLPMTWVIQLTFIQMELIISFIKAGMQISRIDNQGIPDLTFGNNGIIDLDPEHFKIR